MHTGSPVVHTAPVNNWVEVQTSHNATVRVEELLQEPLSGGHKYKNDEQQWLIGGASAVPEAPVGRIVCQLSPSKLEQFLANHVALERGGSREVESCDLSGCILKRFQNCSFVFCLLYRERKCTRAGWV